MNSIEEKVEEIVKDFNAARQSFLAAMNKLPDDDITVYRWEDAITHFQDREYWINYGEEANLVAFDQLFGTQLWGERYSHKS